MFILVLFDKLQFVSVSPNEKVEKFRSTQNWFFR